MARDGDIGLSRVAERWRLATRHTVRIACEDGRLYVAEGGNVVRVFRVP